MKRIHWFFAFLVMVAAAVSAVFLARPYWNTALQPLPTMAATTIPLTNTPITTPHSPLSTLHSPPTPTTVPLTVTIPDVLNLDAFAPDMPLILEFSRPMDTEAADPPLIFEPEVEGQTSWDEAGRQLVFTPVDTFSYGRTYRVTLADDVHAADGASFTQPQQWQLRVPYAPKVIGHTPTAVRLTDLQPQIALSFNRPMDEVSVIEALHIEPPLPLVFSWRNNTLTITLEERLLPGEEYRFVLDRAAADVNGVPLTTNYTWRYQPAPVVNIISGPSTSLREQPVRIVFNYVMDRSSVAEVLEIEPEIVGEWSWDANGKVAVISPTVPLENETEYLFRFTGNVRDAQGGELPLPEESLSLITPPAIVSHSPSGTNIGPATTIRVRFDRLMDEQATAATFSIEPETPGTLRWEETTLIFQPEGGAFVEQTSYTVSVTAAARGAGGEAVLKDDYTWVFSTTPFIAIASFGEGPNAQVLNAVGRRAVQFTLQQEDTAELTFKLYQLTLAQYLDRYSSGFRGVAGTENRPIDTTGTTLVREWTVTAGDSPVEWSNIQEALLPEDVGPGLYILNLEAGRLNDQLILVLTHYTVLVKQAEGQLVAWVTDINGGAVAGANVAVYARDGELIREGVAGENGVFRTDIGEADPQPLIVVAGLGEDRTASGLSNEWRSQGGYGWWMPAPQALDYAAYVYTDRPIYRPGQEVFYKAILRQDDDAILSNPPEGTAVTVRIRDARNNVVQTAELATNSFGSVNGSFQLAEGAMLGEWMVEVAFGEETHTQVFKVEEYRKPDYQVTVTADQSAYVTGDTISLTVESLYYLGEPVANADVEIRLYDLYANYNYDSFGETTVDSYYWSPATFPAATSYDPLRGETDEDGRMTLTLAAEAFGADNIYEWHDNFFTRTLAVEATIDDGSRQTVSGFVVLKVANVSERITLDTDGYLHQPGVPFPISIDVEQIAGATAGEPAAGRTVTLSLRRWDETNYTYSTVLQSVELTTGEDGRAMLDFTAAEAGYYQMLVEGTDSGNRQIAAETYVFIYSDATDLWYGQYSSGLRINADRKQYAPGNTARLLIESDFSGPALLTFERGTTRREQVVQLTAPVTAVEVIVQPEDAPNIYVTVNAWQAQDTTLTENTYDSLADARLNMAGVSLSVPVTNKTLNVVITPDREGYGPREEATFAVRVTNQAGEPVAGEVSLAMVDEAIFALSAELAGPLFDAFYYERPNIVRTYDALSPRRYLGGGGMGGGGGDGLMAGEPRSDFPDTAEWFPTLLTDANGEAQVTITLPDSLTTWRLTAKVVTADTQVGETTATITTRKAIVVRPILPRGLTAGDQAALTTLIHNYSTISQTITVTLREAGTPLLQLAGETQDHRQTTADRSQSLVSNLQSPISNLQSPISTVIAMQTITLEAGERGLVGWPVVAREAGETAVIVEATAADGLSDAVQLPLVIRPLAVPDVTSQVGEFNGELATNVEWAADALPMSNVRLELSRSVAGTLLEGLDYLTGFPYGCVEQTMSRALPNAVVGRAFFQLGVSDPTIEADLPAMISDGLQRLYGFQHNDGGWGWWYDDSSHDYQTAWVVFGLATMAEAGYEVDPGVIERGITWLDEHLTEMDIRTQVYAVYAMSVAAKQPGVEIETGEWRVEIERLGDSVEELDVFSQAALALVLYEEGNQAGAEDVLALLAETVRETEDGRAYWASGEEDGYYDQKTMASDTRSTALALSAFARIDPTHPLQGAIARWLVDQRQPEGWGTTNETSYAILGLTDHLLASDATAEAETFYTVTVNGEVVADGRLGPGQPTVSIEMTAEKFQVGENELVITTDSAGPLYYTLNSRMVVVQEAVAAAGNVSIVREYLDPVTNAPLEIVTAGELVLVRLRVDLPADKSYLLVEDKLPGGLEALNERLNTTSHAAQLYEEPTYYWMEYGYNHKEIRDGRVTFFITEVSEGMHDYTYLARATHTGEFVALSAEVWAMYDLSTWGRSESSEVVVETGD